ncbi:MAG TPA: protein-L-isoaspartate(D-aspartate) O-methyltransferase [Stenotrophobium sp.]|jgi:protein-L-isoaspartate(D-aspartate) O-methyltransferase|nr:protein-L-isoaspartate(D-aspartate) O-methyltransferase [Stenotrophobium sp.]
MTSLYRPQPARGQDFVVSRRRQELVDRLRREGIHDANVLAAMEKVPRHEFVDELLKSRAYENTALPIGNAQTISQPVVVALMTQALLSGRKLKRVLEIGTGSGYQTAVLAELVESVFTVERIKPLTEQARKRLAHLGYRNIHFGYADGISGWTPYAPYDGIIVTAGTESVPRALTEQLAVGGRMLIPVGPQGRQSLRLIERSPGGYAETDLAAVSFVPLLAGRD